ncbi:TetR family transcriptional regulator [uncultured Hyphomonas sp.]|uniref:TetR/AcrR family transcriptional regulator n=1 Tax=uncultured Hyphomonas sp. TaxID=225298 RepID=UPI000C57237A|nr:hypothetical protein [Hyphomonadaceae bacterium]MBA29750.1 hypothetical protein [Hyphomonadaceae bacterium]|tara:strand:- start:3930 stop:4505 length:576 start_codon:yes stop_codon:yes gene_type:complete
MNLLENTPPAQSFSTRDRILHVAAQQFGAMSYERATLREIARKSEVDVAYVHRLFGSKKSLFQDVLAFVFEQYQPPEDAGEGFSHWLVQLSVQTDPVYAGAGSDPVDLVINSFSSPDSKEALEEFLSSKLITPLAASLTGDRPVDAAEKILMFLLGFRLMRKTMQVQTLMDMNKSEVETWLQDILGRLTDG